MSGCHTCAAQGRDPEHCGTPPDELDMGPVEEAVCGEVEDDVAEALRALRRAYRDGVSTMNSQKGCEFMMGSDCEVLVAIKKSIAELKFYF